MICLLKQSKNELYFFKKTLDFCPAQADKTFFSKGTTILGITPVLRNL